VLPTGKVKWFNSAKGFGFIVPDDSGSDVYIPMRKVEEANLPHLETRTALRYTIGDEKGRQFAENLSLIESPKASSAPEPAPSEGRSRELDPLEEFEREWGLRAIQ
jgi:CspA family cold shock protein